VVEVHQVVAFGLLLDLLARLPEKQVGEMVVPKIASSTARLARSA